MKVTEKIEKFANILFCVQGHVHGNFLHGFYKYDGNAEPEEYSYFWDSLEEKTTDVEIADKDFFRKMAIFFVDELGIECSDKILTEEDLESYDYKKIESLAKMLSLVHSLSLAPFYDDDDTLPFWDELKDEAISAEEVSRNFFRRMAKYFILVLSIEFIHGKGNKRG